MKDCFENSATLEMEMWTVLNWAMLVYKLDHVDEKDAVASSALQCSVLLKVLLYKG